MIPRYLDGSEVPPHMRNLRFVPWPLKYFKSKGKVMLDGFDKCPQCQKDAMPKWNRDGRETARACRECGKVEEKPQ